ncbi:MAG: pirin family protein [Chlorobiales bacterium]|nr:pirin family protein [Chlorobiales bacterium]
MISVRKSSERGHFDHGWLNTYHTFSFAGYYDEKHMGLGALRVINEDRVQPARGFPTHPHRDMEIITYVIEGALEHKDNMGNGSVIRPGDVQRMTAGTGITHSEYNNSATELVHFFQIWIIPETNGLTPGYEQTSFSSEEKQGVFRLIASRDGRDRSVTIHRDVNFYAALLDADQEIIYNVPPERRVWVQVVCGKVLFNDYLLEAGDGAAVSDEELLSISAEEAAEILLFDLD